MEGFRELRNRPGKPGRRFVWSRAVESGRVSWRLKLSGKHPTLYQEVSAAYPMQAWMLADVVRQLRDARRQLFERGNEYVDGVAVAPWSDYAGHPIHAGDVLQHPTSERGIVVHQPESLDVNDRWFVDYGGYRLRLSLQIGDKGRAVVVRDARSH